MQTAPPFRSEWQEGAGRRRRALWPASIIARPRDVTTSARPPTLAMGAISTEMETMCSFASSTGLPSLTPPFTGTW